MPEESARAGDEEGRSVRGAVRVLIADDQPMVRMGLALILRTAAGIEVVGEAGDGAAAVRLAGDLRPDVVLMDIRMPVMDGVEATRRLAAEQPGCRVLALSTFDMDEYVVDALRAGACGFLPKDVTAEHLTAAVRTVAEGEAVVAPRLLTRLIATFVGAPPAATPQPAPSVLQDLTPREVEVLRLLAGGLDNTEIAQTLLISVSTVKKHVANLFAKLEVRDRAQAVIAAYESGLVRARTAVV
ncbi:response regulator transcription factor [Streptomyces mashuensis]|uniref:response regulator transcription factor n=1 Tax=Streptomyces mashuensis TaxID=33904 RepID=UPI00227D7366|nr:response regulator transcription factor [Streptomyces mashuensis]